MQVKNVSGGTHTFAFGRKVARTLANNEIVTVPNSPEAIADALTWRNAGILDIIEGAPALFQSRFVQQHLLFTFTGAVGDTELVTIGTEVFEFDTGGHVITAGHTEVQAGANCAASAANPKTAINANAVLAALGIVATDILTISSTTLVYLIVEVGPDVVLADLTATDGGANIATAKVDAVEPTAREPFVAIIPCTTTTVVVYTGLRTIYEYFLSLKDATGVEKNYDGAVTISGGTMQLNAVGNVDPANTDVLHVLAFGKSA